ncbi:MAG: YggT family protein [Actinobacteria bacterium]|jgi:YggT family protein|nr:YggT family protein [Actinomycetota bacterium]NBO51128.1 YggT family protein [Actinomycetota bacterium]NBQ59536.1 YggT family protein [Actinomycetota bacterium]NBY82563.1 YggT family protein [Actinomycetota bacterium]NCA25451.1 YggT family protein [Actinomycetota bacterium]
MGSILGLIYWVLNLFLFALIARLILDYVRMFSPNWRPKGVVLAAAELVYSVTDKPLSFTRQFVPPLRLGGIALDLSFIVVFFVVQLLMRLVVAL